MSLNNMRYTFTSESVAERHQDKVADLIADAVADLGKLHDTGRVFAGFQKHLHNNGNAA